MASRYPLCPSPASSSYTTFLMAACPNDTHVPLPLCHIYIHVQQFCDEGRLSCAQGRVTHPHEGYSCAVCRQPASSITAGYAGAALCWQLSLGQCHALVHILMGHLYRLHIWSTVATWVALYLLLEGSGLPRMSEVRSISRAHAANWYVCPCQCSMTSQAQGWCYSPVRRNFVLRCFDLGCWGTSGRLWLLLLLDTWLLAGCAAC